MNIVVETGTGLNPLANSYSGLQEVKDYAHSRGLAFTCDNGALSQYMLRAMDYIETREYQGYPASEGQPLSWPRSCVYINGKMWAGDSIPAPLKKAHIETTIAISNGFDPLANVDNKAGQVIEEQVDVIRVKYAEGLNRFGLPRLTVVETLLAPLLSSGGSPLSFVRV